MSLTSEKLPKGRYLITGAAGFVGSHMAERLHRLGSEVIALDNLISGTWKNVEALKGKPGFSSLEKDIAQPLKIDGPLTGIFHLACPASPIDYAKFPIETLKTGSLGSHTVLDLAREKKCPILLTSTSEVYGDPLEHPQKEEYWGNVNPIGPRSCYDEAKRYMEAVTMAYKQKHGIATKLVRIFNTYGPRMRAHDGRVVPNFCMQALQNQDITVYGDGQQTRSFCYVDDLVEGIIRIYLCEYGLPINLGNPDEFTVLDFAKMVIERTESHSKIKYVDLPQDDPKLRRPDITKARELLGWSPKTKLSDGLNNVLEYFRTCLP